LIVGFAGMMNSGRLSLCGRLPASGPSDRILVRQESVGNSMSVKLVALPRVGPIVIGVVPSVICATGGGLVWLFAPLGQSAAAFCVLLSGSFLAGWLPWAMQRRLLRRVEQVGATLDRILGGALETEAEPGSADLAALVAMQERVRKQARAHLELLKQQLSLRDEVTKARATAIEQMAERFEREASAAISEVTNSARELEQLADDLDTSATRLEKEAALALSDAEGSACGADAAAASTAHLATAVAELTGQIVRAASGTASIATRTVEARTLFSELASTITEIGQVSKLIGGIAGQTNLLALNASIEAARAGEAGRGFAVVAGEVKTLASQTARATTDIAERINGIQRRAAAAREAVEQIADAVSEVDGIAAAIAAGMAEQSSGVRQIARAAADASEGARRAMGRVGAATEEIGNNRMSVGQIHDAAGAVFASLHGLEGRVAGFVKAAVSEAGRRRSLRFEVSLPCTIEVGGQRVNGTIHDLSAGGARLQAPVVLAQGDIGSISTPGLPRISFRLLSQTDYLAVAFIFSSDTEREAMHDAILNLIARQEAAA